MKNGSFISKGALLVATEKKKEVKKMAFQPLLQIHHYKGYRNCRFRCQSQLAHDPGQTEAPFALPELALNRYPIEFILAGLQVDLPPLFNLGRRPA